VAVDSQLPLFGCRDFGFGLLCVAITQKQTFLLARAEENLAFGMGGGARGRPFCFRIPNIGLFAPLSVSLIRARASVE